VLKRYSKTRLKQIDDLPNEVWRALESYPGFSASSRYRIRDDQRGRICVQHRVNAKRHVILRNALGEPISRNVAYLVFDAFPHKRPKSWADRKTIDSLVSMEQEMETHAKAEDFDPTEAGSYETNESFVPAF
jgi:hypothetical protein